MIVRSVLMTVILIGICASPVRAEATRESEGAGFIAASEKAISEAKEGKEAALLGKKLGDYYVSREDYKSAANEYLKALSASPTLFTEEERFQMALAISWADRLDDAGRVLRSILDTNPKQWKARLQLARVLSWSERLNEAAVEVDRVLDDQPENKDALLVKANVLRWKGDSWASIPVYEKALAQGENFDAGIGLAFAYLESGEKDAAREVSKTLKPSYPYQNKELAKFTDALCTVRASHLGIQYSYLKDSDDNRVNRHSLLYGFWAGSWETELAYQRTDATDPARQEKTETIRVTAHARSGRIGMGAGAGVVRKVGSGGGLVAGQGNGDITFGWGTVGASVARDVLTDTAQLIENGIVQTIGALTLTETMSPRVSLSQNYTRSDYSDGNSADDLRFGARYIALPAASTVAVGYRLRYWNFRRQSGGGYFDPADFLSHQVYVALHAETNGYYAHLEPYIGHQAFTRNGKKTSDIFSGASALAGLKIKKCASFEINGEGGNYAAGSTAGYNYYQAGFRLIFNF